MACGTPVVAYRRGSMPELVEEGVGGFLVDSIEGALQAVQRCAGLHGGSVRTSIEDRFGADRMVDEYLALYHELLRR